MTAGTVLFLFHYVPDVIAAVEVGVVAVVVDDWWTARRAAHRLAATARAPRQRSLPAR